MSAKLDTATFTGKSGRAYDFRIYLWEHKFKALPAVYIVTERAIEPNSPPTFSPVYVGVTDDLSRIFESHEKQECFEMYYANTIAVLAESDPSERARVLQDLLEALDPPCNQDAPC